MTRQEIELINHAMNELHELQMSVEERGGRSGLLKRIDTIIGKLYDLQYYDQDKRK